MIWLHWTPYSWRGPLPFEIGLYFFLTLTGFLITRVLLRDRAQGEASGQPWKSSALRFFYKRRAIRILIPCYAGMAFAWIFAAPDIRAHPLLYLAHIANFHIAMLPEWPSGTAHYWTLAIQMQFYLLWPLIIYFVPRRGLLPVLFGFAALAPLTRWLVLHHFPEVQHPGAISTAAADYFGVGALLAVAMDRGMKAGDKRLKLVAWAAFVSYAALYCFDEIGRPIDGLRHVQQTLVSVVFAGLISTSLRGFHGSLGHILDHPAIQHVGKLSYGLYLFHTTIPLAMGFCLPFLWHPIFEGPLFGARLLAFALGSWGLAWLSWRYLEQPFDRFRQAKRAG